MNKEHESLLDTLDTKEPLMAVWALDCISNIALLDPERAEALIRKLMATVDLPSILPPLHAVDARGLLSRIPSEYWTGREDELVAWSRLHGGDYLDVVAGHLMALDEERGFSFLGETIESEGVKANPPVRLRLLTFLGSLESLASEAFCHEIVDSWEDDPQFFSRERGIAHMPGWQAFYTLAWRGNHELAEALARSRFLDVSQGDFFSYMEYVEEVAHQEDLFSSTLLALKVIFQNGNEFGLSEVGRFFNRSPLFEEGVALFDHLVAGDEIDLGLRGLFIKYGERIACGRLRRLLAALLVDDAFKEAMSRLTLEDPETSHWGCFQLFVLAALLTADRREEGDFNALDASVIVELLTHVLLTDTDRGRFVDALRSCERGMVVLAVGEALEQAKVFGDPRDTLLVMRDLGYPEWLPQLAEMFDEDFEILHTRVMDAIVRTGDEGSAFIRDSFEHCDRGDTYLRMNLIETVGKMPRPAMVAFLEEHFEAALRVNREMAIYLCSKAAWEGALPWLLPRFGKKQAFIDEVCLVIAGVHGLSLEGGDAVAEECRARVADQNRRIRSVLSGASVEPSDSLELELCCGSCGEEAFYEVDHVFSDEDGKHFIGVELQCIGCHEYAFFNPTQNGLFRLNAELMRAMEQYDREGGRFDSVIDLARGVSFGKMMSIAKSVETYQAKINKEPLNAQLQLGYGNVMKFCHHYRKSMVHYSRCLELEPAMLQAYIGAAQVEEVRGNDQAAFAWLQKGAPYLKRPLFKVEYNFDPTTFLFAYCDLHNAILKRLDLDAEALSPPLQPEITTVRRGKIGRNAPCPCGSGKKYKKCCAMKRG